MVVIFNAISLMVINDPKHLFVDTKLDNELSCQLINYFIKCTSRCAFNTLHIAIL